MLSAMRYFQLTIPGMVVLTIVSCNQSSSVQERNKALLLKAHEELLDKGNLSFADECFDAEYTYSDLSEKGPAQIKTFVADLKEAFPDLHYELDHIVAEGNTVAWRRTMTGTHKADYMGYKATGKSIRWQEVNVTNYTDDGKIAKEWGASDFDVSIQRASGVDGVYENLPPTTGLTTLHNGRFVFLFGPSEGSGPFTGQAGTYTVDSDKFTHTHRFSTNPKEVGTSFSWKVKSWSGDTLTFVFVNDKGEETGEGRAVRVSY